MLPTKKILLKIQEEVSSKGNPLALDAISRLMDLFEGGSFDIEDLPLAKFVDDLQSFKNGEISQYVLLGHFILYLDIFSMYARDLGIADAIGKLQTQIETNIEKFDKQGQTIEVDFKEIPAANQGSGDQDDFELFARDFLKLLGYVIEQGPGRGPDRGKDLIVMESLQGIQQREHIRWLVSCKHYAHSGVSVKPVDEPNLTQRLVNANCNGFMGFYSTLPSSGLVDQFEALPKNPRDPYRVFVYDKGEISQHLIKDKRLWSVYSRYFPKSYGKPIKKSIEDQYSLAKLAIEGESEIRIKNAASRLDAHLVHRIKKETEHKLRVIEEKRKHRLKSYLYEEE